MSGESLLVRGFGIVAGVSDVSVVDSMRVDGSGPALVMLHGGPGLSDYMALLDGETVGWRRVFYQQRGLSPSPVEGPFTVARHLADLRSVLDAAGVERAVLLGHSWGTHLGLQAALVMPDRVAALVLVDPFGIVDDGGAVALAEALNERLLPENRARAAEV
ncbi:MAG: alpha/beta fold hydrolase, partial [Solirubrobacteraceae bacterium]